MKKYIGLLIAAALLFGCNIDRFPEDSVTPENYFKTETDLELWCNGFYTMFTTADDATGMDADDVLDNSLSDYMAGTRSPSTESGWTWGQLRRINYLLEHLGNCEDDAVRAKYEGVARFFRAYFYYAKVRRYGDVPWYDLVPASNDDRLYKARDDRGFVMDKVMEDFDAAARLLPADVNVSRVNKWAALAFKSRAALFEGTWRKYHGLDGAEIYLQQAADAAATVMDSGKYSLNTTGTTPYRDLFNKDGANEKEFILTRIYNSELTITHSVQQAILNEKRGFTKRFMNHYLMADGTRFCNQRDYATMTYSDETVGRDPRMAQTVMCPGYIQTGTSIKTSNTMNARTGYQPIKFVAEPSRNSASQGISDFPLMRLAEVYLNYAEALAELGTLTQADVNKSVGKLRSRAGLPALDITAANNDPDPLLERYYPNVTRSAFTGVILEIRRERTVEMVMEGQRVWDMIRWKEGAQMVNTPNPWYGCYFPGPGAYDMDGDGTVDVELYTSAASSAAAAKFLLGTDIVLSEGNSGYVVAFSGNTYTWSEERDYLWPIPSAQRELNKSLNQNPGWGE